MGMKLKSGADLCGFELSRFCVQNDVAIPDAPASGRKYFHTGTGMEGKYSLLGRERIFTGTSWRAAAYVDDLANLDITSNADYLALKERVDAFLDGEVDSNGVLDNLKEIQKFLDNYSSATDLTAILDTKLDKTGGTIQGSNEAGTADTPLIVKSANRIYTAISLQTPEKEAINLRWYNQYGVVLANSSASTWIVLGEDKSLYYTTDGAVTKHTIIHSGNVGGYAIKRSKNISFENDINIAGYGSTEGGWTRNGAALILGYDKDYKFFLQADYTSNSHIIKTRYYGGGTWRGDWKTIAFTDSNVASATKLETPRTIWGQSFDGTSNISASLYLPNASAIYFKDTNATNRIAIILNDGNEFSVGFGVALAGYNTSVVGNNVYLKYGKSANIGLILNSSGNVTIGYADFARSKWKTFITGNTFVYSLVDANARPTLGNIPEGVFSIGYHLNGDVLYGLHMWSENSGNGVIQASRADGTAKKYSILLNPLGGNVGIGLTSPSAQLHVNEDIVANGTVACKGVAAEGSAPVGTVDKWAGSIASGTKSQTYTHGLGTTDITVAIYEKNGNEWVQILTDVDIVNANTIRVTFGANTTVEHRIVVMG